MHQATVKIALIIAIFVLGGYTFLVNGEINNYQQVHSICSKAVLGFPADKLAPLAHSGDLITFELRHGISMAKHHCSCIVETRNGLVSNNAGTSCKS